ncbi:uncharacterized protein PG986_004722 [Apiospora aurea]|uniref:Uncharacterized protein n=1 Tax=Apiospora aurea TaxID=335848 RepID=A0ABR1QND3_9PEZI
MLGKIRKNFVAMGDYTIQWNIPSTDDLRNVGDAHGYEAYCMCRSNVDSVAGHGMFETLAALSELEELAAKAMCDNLGVEKVLNQPTLSDHRRRVPRGKLPSPLSFVISSLKPDGMLQPPIASTDTGS